jgi:hypothetical protein
LRPRERTSTFDLLVVGEIKTDLLLYGDVTPEFGQAEKLVKDAVDPRRFFGHRRPRGSGRSSVISTAT